MHLQNSGSKCTYPSKLNQITAIESERKQETSPQTSIYRRDQKRQREQIKWLKNPYLNEIDEAMEAEKP